MVTITKELALPIVKVIIPAGTTVTISFPNQFFGIASDLRLTNLDNAAVGTFRINGASSPLLTLLAGAILPYGGTQITLITITAAIGGATQLEANIEHIG